MTASRFPFTAFPTGWYRVATASHLRPGRVQSVRAFGQELVAFRGADQRVRVIDAFCPHLGAHLGQGGRVEGDAVICPFHGWRIYGDGRCAQTPTGSEPPREGSSTWVACERNGAVMVWFDAERRKPAWPVPKLSQWGSREWTRFGSGRLRTVSTHVQELAENGMDLAHFTQVHGKQIAAVHTDLFSIDGPRLTHRIANGFRVFGLAVRNGVEGSLQFDCHGLGMTVVHARVEAPVSVEFLSVLYFTPIDDEQVAVQADYSLRRKGAASAVCYALSFLESERAIADDTKILATKAYVARPPLGAADGPISPFRDWAVQFYPACGGA